MTPTRQEFEGVCRRHFGRPNDGYGWQRDMSRRLNTSERTIASWGTETPVHPAVWALLLMLDGEANLP